jgi:signal transduction histidine kinase
VLGIASDYTGLGDAVAASIVLLFPAALGASVRYWTTSRVRTVEQVKLLEREQLARELHDTVAHHVSAIVVRAQAGQVVGTSDREAATAALKVIEHEAARTLAEMRSLVGALRDGEEADLAPQRGIADLSQLANSFLDGPPVAVELSGDLDDLSPSLDAAVYRIVQESITNAAQHARHATRVSVRVSGDDDSVRLAVRDNGDHPPSDRGKSGYGLIGMTERALLLGGVLTAGPLPGGGWSVDAALPKQASAR